MLNMTRESDTAQTATGVFLELGPAGIPPLAKVLEKPPQPIRRFAVGAIELRSSGLGPEAETLVPGLIQCLNDNDPETRALAVSALGRLKMSAELAVPALESCLQSPNSQLRASAATSLYAFQAQALPALPALTNFLADADANVRFAASNAVLALNAVALTNAPPQ